MDVSTLRPGDHHYMAYVGPPLQYDFMGATQFRLLTTLGLRAGHRLLDFGCGSLRAGRLFLPYLDADRYFGVEPNAWLIDDAVENQVGRDLVRIKRPRFDHNDRFATDVFGVKFDFILAQSIFSHTGADLTITGLRNFRGSLADGGLALVTFVEGADATATGWVYPGCTTFTQPTVERFARDAGLFAARLPWYHPRQVWYAMAKDRGRLPSAATLGHLTGAVLNDPEFVASCPPPAEAPAPRGLLSAVKARLGGSLRKAG